MLIWGAHHEQTGASCAVIDQMEQNRAAVLAETYRRWAERDPTPILPSFTLPSTTADIKVGARFATKNSPKGKLQR
jgi:hypothetical protein